MINARNGKIARLPEPVRRELNQRLKNGEIARIILPWLNALPEVRRVLAEFFGGLPVNEPNLCAWRRGGFVDWEQGEEKAARIVDLASLAASLPGANVGGLAEGASAIASARIFEVLEAMDGTPDLERLSKAIQSLGTLRAIEIARQNSEIQRARIEQRREAGRLRQLRTNQGVGTVDSRQIKVD